MKQLTILLAMLLFAIGGTAAQNATNWDVTAKVGSESEAWTDPQNSNNHTNITQSGITMTERWFNRIPTGEIMAQTVSLPNGTYEAQVYCHGHVAWVSSSAPAGGTGYTTLSANGVEADIPVIHNTGWNANEPTLYTLRNIPVTDGTLTFSLRARRAGANWFTIRVKSLVCTKTALIYTPGDMDEDDGIGISDVTSLVNVLLGRQTDFRKELADVNEDGTVNVSDVTSLVNVILGRQESKTVDKTHTYADATAMVYAGQQAAENAAGAGYMLQTVKTVLGDEDISEDFDIGRHVTTLRITTTLPNVAGISIYALDKAAIAGPMTVQQRGDAMGYAYANGAEQTYASGLQSDVVTVSGTTEGTYVAYLRPVALTKGVKVTVRTTDGQYYSQDFASLSVGQTNDLTFTQTTASNLWMATIPGNTYFSMVSTPGAHDAATSGVSGSLSSYSKCQSLDLARLLASGVRAFDLRPGYYYSSTITQNNLYIYHSSSSTGVLYRDAIKVFADFLRDNPSEAISIIMVKENNGSGTDRSGEMWSAMNAIHSTYGSYMKLLDHSYYTLDDFRGKMCYINRTGTECTNTTRITNWPDDASVTNYSCAIGGTCSACVEDAYQSSGSTKQKAVKALLDLASANTNRARFHYTYTSVGYWLAGTPAANAGTQNAYAANYVGQSLTGPTGYVYGDFMGDDGYNGTALVKAVIEQNYKYVFKGRNR